MDRPRFRVHQLAHRGIRRAAQQITHRKHAPVALPVIHNKHAIQVFGQFPARAQGAQHPFQRDVSAHRHRLRHHESAGRIRRKSEHRTQELLVVLVKRAHDALGNIVRQVRHQVGEIVQRQSLGGIHQRCGLHALHDLGANLFIEFNKNLALVLLVNQFPGKRALARGQRLKEDCGFARA